jgi:hypothetical protein
VNMAEEKKARDHGVTGTNIHGRIDSVGAGGQAAIGQNIHQASISGAPALTTTERREVEEILASLKAQAQALAVDERTKILAEERVDELSRELTQREKAPDPSIIKVAGNWLLDHIPGIAGAVTTVFTNPVVGKLAKAAGDVATGWIKERLGHEIQP